MIRTFKIVKILFLLPLSMYAMITFNLEEWTPEDAQTEIEWLKEGTNHDRNLYRIIQG